MLLSYAQYLDADIRGHSMIAFHRLEYVVFFFPRSSRGWQELEAPMLKILNYCWM